MSLYRLKELTNANDKLRAQLTDKDHSVAMLQMSITSLENRLGAMAAREQQQLERPLGSSGPVVDSDDTAYDALHSIARQLIQDSDQVRNDTLACKFQLTSTSHDVTIAPTVSARHGLRFVLWRKLNISCTRLRNACADESVSIRGSSRFDVD